MSIFDYVRVPCMRECPYEWGSLRCFERRGQMYDRIQRKWIRDDEGRILIGKKECDYEERRNA